jgi:phage RecT family recombinase
MSTELAVRPKSELQTYLESNIGQLAACCPKHFTPEAMIQVASILVYKTPELKECTKESILGSIVEAGSFGFSLNPKQGECYLIPRKNKNTGKLECTLDIGYRGLAKLARGNGKVEYVVAHVVHEKDLFEVELAPVPTITHKPLMAKDRGPVTYVYSMVKFLTGTILYDYMSKDDVEKIRRMSQKPNGTFWVNHWDEMAKKTIIKRHAKSLDQTPELARAIEIDNEEYNVVDTETSPRNLGSNGTDFGVGKYCSPQEALVCLEEIKNYRDARESQWLDRWTHHATGEIPEGLKELCPRVFPIDDHLAKQAVKAKRLAQDCMDMTGLKYSQEGRLTGILWHRSDDDKAWMEREMKLYFDELERTATDALLRVHPELFSEEKTEEAPVAVVAKPESAPQSEWGKWLVEQVDSFNSSMSPTPPVKAQQVANHLVNEGISDGLIEKTDIETGGKRDNKKVGDLLKNTWNKNAADMMDRVGKYLAAKAAIETQRQAIG